MGGMAAFIPIRSDPAASEAALDRVRADKLREVSDGHDGTWVAHPGLVPVAKAVFDAHMPGPNQVGRPEAGDAIGPDELLAVPTGPISEDGLRSNCRVAIQYIEAWLNGQGCVPLYDLMEDAATAEICRAQVWQWLKHKARLADGRMVDEELVRTIIDEEMLALERKIGRDRVQAGRFEDAVALFRDVATPPSFVEFLTLPAYRRLVAGSPA
jgi:malate synthase